MTTGDKPDRAVKTADTVFGLIEQLREADGAGVTELATSMGMAKSTIHDHLVTLESKGYLVKEGDEYRLSLRFLDHGTYVQHSYELVGVARPKLEELAAETQEAAWLYTEEHGSLVILDRALGDRAIKTLGHIGKHSNMHSQAAGKAILAHLPDDRVAEIVDAHGLPKQTEQTITEREALEEALAEVREQDYATNVEEVVTGVVGISAPIVVDDEVRGAISISGPSNRMQDERLADLADRVIGASNEIELQVEYQDR